MKSPYNTFEEMRASVRTEYINGKTTATQDLIVLGERAHRIVNTEESRVYTFLIHNGTFYKFTGDGRHNLTFVDGIEASFRFEDSNSRSLASEVTSEQIKIKVYFAIIFIVISVFGLWAKNNSPRKTY
jgi:hypothetical protein